MAAACYPVPVREVKFRLPGVLWWSALWLALPAPALFAQPAGPLAFAALHQRVVARFDQTNVTVTFALTNVSAAPVTIRDVSLSCGCSVAGIPARPWTLPPGACGQLTVTTDVRGKRGSLLKTALVLASSGPQQLTYQIDILEPPAAGERARNQGFAKADRQAVFKGGCAQCHAEPARGKLGRELFTAACAICHEAEHRATMVPDLKTLKHPATRDYWRQWIAHGKPETLMPAFAAPAGGPLTDAQIHSLVEFLASR